jgi:hypothetical protein
MSLRIAFWTCAMAYSMVLLFGHLSLQSLGSVLFTATMGAALGVNLACVFARRARRKLLE